MMLADSAHALRLVADIGGTHARFALIGNSDCEPTHIEVLKTSAFPGIVEAIRRYLEIISAPCPSMACVAVACPIGDDEIRLTNNRWNFSIEDARKTLGLKRLLVVNDFKALAMAVPRLGPDELVQFGQGDARANAPISVLGPGTGLGVATVMNSDGQCVVVDGEGGHVGFAPVSQREAELLRFLAKQYGRVSVERILSGPGLAALHKALGVIDDSAPSENETPDIIARAVAGTSQRCRQTIDVFCGILGGFAGDVALMTGSRGGVYIGGGIAPRIIDILGQSQFRTRFEDKGRMTEFAKNIPTHVITASNPALKGAAILLKQTQTTQ